MNIFLERPRLFRPKNLAIVFTFLLAIAAPALAQPGRVVSGHMVRATENLTPSDTLSATNRLNLFLGLPLRNQEELDGLLRDLHDSAGTNYHQWLTPEQFAERFGPTVEDYEKVKRYAREQGFRITAEHSNRVMVNVEASVETIEKTFKLKLRRFQHPREDRKFYAPDTEPTVNADVPIMHIAGLDNFSVPRRMSHFRPVPLDTNGIVAYATGSSPNGNFFMGKDFRHAYVPGVTNTGAGQYIAIVDVGGPYYSNDVYMYEVTAGLSTNTVVTNILLSGSTGIPNGTNVDEGEQVLDIDMAMSMAPDAVILNYEGEAHDVFSQIAIDNKAKQMTLSYGFGIDSIIQQIFQQFVAQGQAMSQASGDGGADLDGGTGLTGAPYSTIVGGVSLTMLNSGASWLSETTWIGSGGGISGYGIPTWQQGINMTTNLGSISFRNYPDVSMPADNIFTIYENGSRIGATGGTSAASPLWAGFMALVNQQAASLGKPPVGFANPAIYALGKGARTNYTNCFHDTTTGNTFNSQNPVRYAAVAGYDLATGWGSPAGSNAINYFAGSSSNDFVFFPSQGTFNLLAGGTATATINMTRENGFTGAVAYSVTGLPAGISAVINPSSTTNATTMYLTTTTNVSAGNYSFTLTGTLGSLVHSVAMNVVIATPIPGQAKINFTFNLTGLYTDGRTFSGGFDGGGSAFSASLLGNTVSFDGLLFNLGPSNAPNAITCTGQVVNLPAGQFGTLHLLGAAVQGSQASQTFVVTYTDNSTVTFTQSVSDWANAQAYPGEFTVVKMGYRDLSTGGSQTINVAVYGYSFALDPTKTVKSLKLPGNSNVILLAGVLGTDVVTVSLSTYFNRAGMYTDGATFTNPATGGFDGNGNAFSASLLGGSQIWTNTVFSLGSPNVTNVISGSNQTILLPQQNCAQLRFLAASVNGNFGSQVFVVTYTDNTTTTFLQGISDSASPQNLTGESKAIVMGHRNLSNGTKDSRTFYLYGYTFALNSAKTVKSIRLPNNVSIIIVALSLVPNWPPTFKLNPFAQPIADAGQNYSASISTNLNDLNGGALTTVKVSGPAWLNVATGGALSGTPANTDANTNTFVVSVTDSGGLSNTATFTIYVNGAPAFGLNPFSGPGATPGQNYSASIAGSATDPNPGDALTFAKVSGPVWLAVGSDGTLSGQPSPADAGTNTFVVTVTDPRGLMDTATLSINVVSPAIVSSIGVSGTNFVVSWVGGVPPFQVQVSTDLTTGWSNFGGPTNTNSIVIAPTDAAAFFRIIGQ